MLDGKGKGDPGDTIVVRYKDQRVGPSQPEEIACAIAGEVAERHISRMPAPCQPTIGRAIQIIRLIHQKCSRIGDTHGRRGTACLSRMLLPAHTLVVRELDLMMGVYQQSA